MRAIQSAIAIGVACLFSPAHASAESRIALEEATYRVEMLGDYDRALELAKGIWSDPEADVPTTAEALLLGVRIELRRGAVNEARELYKRLSELGTGAEVAVADAKKVVPVSFIQGQIPWRDGERLRYRWMDADGRTTGHCLIKIDQIRQGATRTWRLTTLTLADDLQVNSVELDENLAQVKTANYRSRPAASLPVEVASLLQPVAAYFGDVEVVGQLLRKERLSPGIPTSSQIYLPHEGSVVDAEIELRRIEFPAEPAGGVGLREVEVTVGEQKAHFWFRQDRTRTLVRHQMDGLRGELEDERVSDGSGSRVVDLGRFGIETPDDWWVVSDTSDRSEQTGAVLLVSASGDVVLRATVNEAGPAESALTPSEWGADELLMGDALLRCRIVRNTAKAEGNGNKLVEFSGEIVGPTSVLSFEGMIEGSDLEDSWAETRALLSNIHWEDAQ